MINSIIIIFFKLHLLLLLLSLIQNILVNLYLNIIIMKFQIFSNFTLNTMYEISNFFKFHIEYYILPDIKFEFVIYYVFI